MSKRDVYNRLRITAPVRNQIKGFTAQSVKSVYGGELRKQVASVGGPRGALTISDPRSLAAIDRQASVTATSIQRTYNRMLQNAIDRLPNGTSAELMAGLKPFIDKTRGYNTDTLVPLASDLARQTARNDFVANNDLPGHWEFYGPAQCPRCQEAREDTSVMLPNHPHCECGRTFVVSGAIAPGQALWAGAEEPITADAELAMVGVERRKASTLPAILKDWSEAAHPRGWHGRFAPSGSSGSSGEHESGGAGGGRIEMAAAKLTLNDARRVRNSYHSGDSIATVARLHGLSTTAVRNIIAHKTHRETFVKGEKTTIYHARQIRADHAAGKSVKDLATETGLSDRFIRKVIAHQAHREPKGGGGEVPKPGPKDVPRRRPATPEPTHPMTPEPRPHPEQERIAPEAVTHLSQLQGKLHLYTRDEKQQMIENAIWRFSDEVKAPSKPGEHTHWPHAEAGRSNSEAGRRMNRGMEDVGRGRGIRVNEVVERGKNRLGYVNPDRPHIVNLKSGLKPDVRGMVMAHEMGHLKEPQDMATKLYFQSKNARGQSEARVEAQAALIGEFYGLPATVRAQSRDYVRGWVGRHHTFSAIDRPYIIDQVLEAIQMSSF